MEFFKRGWTSGNSFRLEGEVYNSKGEAVLKIEGKWSESISLINIRTGKREVLWVKEAYPENWQFMYGMTKFGIQLNYFPNFLQDIIPPTDTRRRPD